MAAVATVSFAPSEPSEVSRTNSDILRVEGRRNVILDSEIRCVRFRQRDSIHQSTGIPFLAKAIRENIPALRRITSR